MNPEKVKIYTAEFRENAMKLATGSSQSVAQVARDLGMNVNTLHTWIYKYTRPQPPKSEPSARTDDHLYDELKRLRKDFANVKEGRDILKKALAYFARPTS
jgi:transposase